MIFAYKREAVAPEQGDAADAQSAAPLNSKLAARG